MPRLLDELKGSWDERWQVISWHCAPTGATVTASSGPTGAGVATTPRQFFATSGNGGGQLRTASFTIAAIAVAALLGALISLL